MWDKVKKNYYDYGIRNFWLDESEPEVHPQQFANLKFYLGNGAQTAMLYPYYYAKMFYEGLKNEGEDKVISLIRAAYPGIQKYGAAVWNGDILSTFEALRMSVKSGLSMAMSGIPWWNSNIMFFDFYVDEKCYTLDDQYMYGEEILFAPIVEQGQEQREVYLPEGNWVNVFDRKTYSGRQTITCHAKLHEFIAFVKEGSDALGIFD